MPSDLLIKIWKANKRYDMLKKHNIPYETEEKPIGQRKMSGLSDKSAKSSESFIIITDDEGKKSNPFVPKKPVSIRVRIRTHYYEMIKARSENVSGFINDLIKKEFEEHE